MAFIIKNRDDMVRMLNTACFSLIEGKKDMLIVPMMIAENAVETSEVLTDVTYFNPRRKKDSLHDDAIGIIRVNAEQTVHDALDQFEKMSLVDVGMLHCAIKSAADNHVKGKTRLLTTPMGQIAVDLEAFKENSGLPLDSDTVDYTVFALEVPFQEGDQTVPIMVAIKGTEDTAKGNGGKDTALDSLMARLEQRASNGMEPGASFHTHDIEDCWELFYNKLFRAAIGWLRRGYTYDATKNDAKGGIEISY